MIFINFIILIIIFKNGKKLFKTNPNNNFLIDNYFKIFQ